MATSTIPAFKNAIRTRLNALTGSGGSLENVLVSYGFPGGEVPYEMVMVGNTVAQDATGGRPGGQSAAAMGFQRREERYVQQIDVRVMRPESQQTVTERAFTIAAAVETSLRAWGTENPAFGGVVRWAQVTAVWHDEAARASERGCVVHVDVSCAERI